jgi:hypothetical protein
VPAPEQTPVQLPQLEAQRPAPTLIAEPQKQPAVVQSETSSQPCKVSEPDISDLPPLEDNSSPTSPNPQPVQYQPQVPDKLPDLLARTQLHNRVVTGSFSLAEFEAAEKFQAKEQLAALIAMNLQLEEARKLQPQGTINKLVKFRFFSLQHASRVARINSHLKNKR